MTIQEQLINDMIGGKKLHEFSTINIRKKRFRKKFDKHPCRYLPPKIIGLLMCISIMRPRNYAEIGRKLFMVEKLPQGAYANLAREWHKLATVSEEIKQNYLDKVKPIVEEATENCLYQREDKLSDETTEGNKGNK